MSVATEIQRLQQAKSALATSIGNKGVTVPAATKIDGYASLVDQIQQGGGGASNIVTGEFTPQSTTGVQTITIPYTGSGYPIMAYIVVKGGAYASGTTWYTTIHQYAIAVWSMSKGNMNSAPTYGTSGAQNYGVTLALYKSSSSSSTSYTRTGGQTTNTFSSSNATSTMTTAARFRSSTQLSIYASAASGTSGFMAGMTYQYVIVYSS